MMEIVKTKKYTHIKAAQTSALDILKGIKKRFSEFENEHLIIDFSEKINTNIEELFLFLDLSTNHRENGISFVIICSEIDTDDLPDEICVVPTFSEALDILEMDEIERDLGF